MPTGPKPARFMAMVLCLASPLFPWHDRTHLAIAKAGGYAMWYNAASPDIAKLKAGNGEGYNHYYNNDFNVVITAEFVMDQAPRYNKADDPSGHLLGAILASIQNHAADLQSGKFAEYHMAYAAHYLGDLSMPLHNVAYDDFNKGHHARNDGIIDAEALDQVDRIIKHMHAITLPEDPGAFEVELGKEIARMANASHALGLRLKAEKRDLTREEAYAQAGESASLLKAVLAHFARFPKVTAMEP